MSKKLNIGQAMDVAWRLTTKNFPYFLGLTVIMFLVNIFFYASKGILMKNEVDKAIIILLNLIGWIIEVVMGMGFIKVSLDILAGKKDPISTLFSSYKPILKYLGAGILGVIISAGPIIFILAGWGISNFVVSQILFGGEKLESIAKIMNITLGILGIISVLYDIFMSIRLMFSPYFIMDKDSGAIESLKLSFRATKGEIWGLFGFNILIAVINFVGSIPFALGLFLTIPLSMIAAAAAYRQITSTYSPESITASEKIEAKTETAAA